MHSLCLLSSSNDGPYLPLRAVSGKTVTVTAPDDWPGQLVNAHTHRGCNPVVCYDGARLTACSFHDMKRSVSLLITSLLLPTRLLTLRSPPPLLGGPKRSIEQARQSPPRADAGQSLARTQPCTSATPQTLPSSQQPLVNGTGRAQQAEAQTPGPSKPQAAESLFHLPVALPTTQHQHMPSLESKDGLSRQLSLDTAKEQHAYHSWARGGNVAQLQGKGPVVNAQTIPARGANGDGVSACRLHISVRRHYKEKGKQLLPLQSQRSLEPLAGNISCVWMFLALGHSLRLNQSQLDNHRIRGNMTCNMCIAGPFAA